MADFYIRTSDLTKTLLSFEKDHLDVIHLTIEDPDDDPDLGGPASLWIEGVNSSSPEVSFEDSIDSDESLADLF